MSGPFRFGGIRIDERGTGATGRGRETFYQSFSSTREFGQVESSRIIATGLRKGRLRPATPADGAHIGTLDLYAGDGEIRPPEVVGYAGHVHACPAW